jgi:GntR family transcriptional repressor for pyruvate dehydrogenase complex
MSFEKIAKPNIVDRVFNALRQEIINGNFQAGTKLPSESVLSEQFGVSKASVKAALHRLITLGLVETKVGQGSFVLDFNPNRYLNQMHDFLLSDSDITQVTEYRLYIEMAITRLAMQKATEKNFKKMEELLWRMEDAIKQNDSVLRGTLDYQFHLEICRATQNSIFVLAYEIIGIMIRQHTSILNDAFFKKIIHQKTGEDVHWKLFHGIKDKNIEICEKCYVDMFSGFDGPPPSKG